MIITLTLNPAIDKTVTLPTFDPSKMNRVLESHQDPGGKGINVSKVIHALGGQSTAMGFVAGAAGNYIADTLSQIGIQTDFVTVSGETRTNLKMFCADNKETIEVNEKGPVVNGQALDALKTKVLSTAASGDICVIAGSLPTGIDQHFYKELISALKMRNVQVILDADGDLFKASIAAKPDYIKPNLKELEGYFGKPIQIHGNDGEPYAALKFCASHFIHMGIPHVIFSLGADGAFYMDKDQAYRVHPIKVAAHSSVGAGDAFVGAVAHSLDNKLDIVDMLKLATATSAGAVMTIGTNPADLQWINAHREDVLIEAI